MFYLAAEYLKEIKYILDIQAIHSYIFLFLSSAWLEISLLYH